METISFMLVISSISLLLCLTLLLYTCFHASVAGATSLILTIVLALMWIVAQMLEFTSSTLALKIFYKNIQYISILYAPVSFLYLVLNLTDKNAIKKSIILRSIVIGVPIIFLLLMWTNESHALLRKTVFIDPLFPYPLKELQFTPLFFGFAIYNFLVNCFTFSFLFEAFYKKLSLYRQHIVLISVGLLLPVLATAQHASQLFPIPYDLTPSLFGLTALLLFWGVFRYHLFDATPIANSLIIEKLKTGTIICNGKGIVIHINEAAKSILARIPKGAVGLPAKKVFNAYPEILKLYCNKEEKKIEIAITKSSKRKHYEVSLTPLQGSLRTHIGHLLALYDISEIKEMEEIAQQNSLHDQLTGLPNRRYFYEQAKQRLDLSSTSQDIL